MKTLAKNKTSTAIALFLMLTIAVTLVALPSANAYNSATQAAIDAGMYWDLKLSDGSDRDASSSRVNLWYNWHDRLPTWCFVVVTPNPIGVGQAISIIFYNPQVPPESSA